MNGVFEIILKKVIDIVGERLKSLFFAPKEKTLEHLMEVHFDLKMLEADIQKIVISLEFILEDFGRNEVSYGEFNMILQNLHRRLRMLNYHLREIQPGLEIYARDALSAIEDLCRAYDFYVNRQIPEDIMNWVAPMGSREEKNTAEWAQRLRDVHQLAVQARTALADFIAETYTFKRFQKSK